MSIYPNLVRQVIFFHRIFLTWRPQIAASNWRIDWHTFMATSQFLYFCFKINQIIYIIFYFIGLMKSDYIKLFIRLHVFQRLKSVLVEVSCFFSNLCVQEQEVAPGVGHGSGEDGHDVFRDACMDDLILPSGKRLQFITFLWKDPPFLMGKSTVNFQMYKWSFSIANCQFTRGYSRQLRSLGHK